MSSKQSQKMLPWKNEPVSPSGASLLDVDEDWALFNDQSAEIPNNAAEIVMYDDSPSRAQTAKKLLEELDEWIKEEPFSDWLEEKIVDIPLFDNVSFFESNPTKSPLGYPIIAKTSLQQEQPQQQHDNTQTLLQEFETVLGDVEACHQIIPPTSSTLTPPQSPPHKAINVDTQLLVTLQPVQPFADNQPIYNIASAENSLYVGSTPRQWTAENISLNAFGGDVANELAVVDEYVRSHTKNVSSPSSPCSSGSSCISADDSTDDPDWSVETERRSLKLKQDVHDSSKYRHKPYSRSSLEDKKVRKKEQNKNAATRYRQKKKQEIKEILGEERELAEHNEQLKEKMKSLQQEIGYLKGFMRDVFKAKGFLK